MQCGAQASRELAGPDSLAALQPMKTRKAEKQMWHLQLSSGEAKHALFGSSKAFRKLNTHLDDDQSSSYWADAARAARAMQLQDSMAA